MSKLTIKTYLFAALFFSGILPKRLLCSFFPYIIFLFLVLLLGDRGESDWSSGWLPVWSQKLLDRPRDVVKGKCRAIDRPLLNTTNFFSLMLGGRLPRLSLEPHFSGTISSNQLFSILGSNTSNGTAKYKYILI